MERTTFPILIIIARPAAGKSEIIDYIKHMAVDERKARLHIQQLAIFDDFPLLWAWFEEDDILARLGEQRLHTDANGYFTGKHLWNVLIHRLCLEYQKITRDNPSFSSTHTALIEFSRGKEHGGYTAAYQSLNDDILSAASILYINVSWEESLRKNRARYNPDKPDSILEHGLDDEKMRSLYRHDDWLELCHPDPDYLHIKGHRVPYAIFENEDDVTTQRSDALGDRLEHTLQTLWEKFSALHK